MVMKTNRARTASGDRPMSVKNAPPSYIKKEEPPPGSLEAIKKTAREARGLAMEIEEAEARQSERRDALRKIERETLPALLNQAQVPMLMVEGEGNNPPFIVERLPYYKASIAASWEPEKRAAAFKTLEEFGGGDLVKSTITIYLPLNSTKLRKAVEKALRALKVDFTSDLSVPWTSLTSWLRECYEKRKVYPPLDIIGGDVGEIAKMSVPSEAKLKKLSKTRRETSGESNT